MRTEDDNRETAQIAAMAKRGKVRYREGRQACGYPAPDRSEDPAAGIAEEARGGRSAGRRRL